MNAKTRDHAARRFADPFQFRRPSILIVDVLADEPSDYSRFVLKGGTVKRVCAAKRVHP